MSGLRTGAFFDVDETVLSVKSMFSFLQFHLAARGEPGSTFARVTNPLRTAAGEGSSREEINRSYYRLLAGEPTRGLAATGRAWFEQMVVRPGFFHDHVVQELIELRDGGPVHLISGSFFACLDPVADHLGVTAVGTRPLVRRGELTGEVLVPVVGVAKAHAVSAVAAAAGLDLAGCSAYGDHLSDRTMLELVGFPVVVGGDRQLRDVAERSGWRVLDPAPVNARTAE